jgi:hypothetical protein
VPLLAWAGFGPRRPATAARARASQASAHADMIHLRTMCFFPSWGRRRALSQPGAVGNWAWRKERN